MSICCKDKIHRFQDNISYNPNPNVHAFYYAWYGNPDVDGKYFHWNHIYMPHWNAKVSAQYPTGKRHQPPDDIGMRSACALCRQVGMAIFLTYSVFRYPGASFYPRLGPYSSLDEEITRSHLLQFWQAGIGRYRKITLLMLSSCSAASRKYSISCSCSNHKGKWSILVNSYLIRNEKNTLFDAGLVPCWTLSCHICNSSANVAPIFNSRR